MLFFYQIPPTSPKARTAFQNAPNESDKAEHQILADNMRARYGYRAYKMLCCVPFL